MGVLSEWLLVVGEEGFYGCLKGQDFPFLAVSHPKIALLKLGRLLSPHSLLQLVQLLVLDLFPALRLHLFTDNRVLLNLKLLSIGWRELASVISMARMRVYGWLAGDRIVMVYDCFWTDGKAAVFLIFGVRRLLKVLQNVFWIKWRLRMGLRSFPIQWGGMFYLAIIFFSYQAACIKSIIFFPV
jgi:hypothetical protein